MADVTEKWPTERAKSGTAGAFHRPGPSGTPVARTSKPGGTVTVAEKSAVDAVEASAKPEVGASVTQPTPGSQARMGKKDPRRMASPLRDKRSFTGPGRVRRQSTVASTGRLTTSAFGGRTTSVVGFSRAAARGRPPTVTAPTSRRAPARAGRGPLGQSRKTSRSVARSGTKRTATRPVTVLVAGLTSIWRS